MKQLKQLLKEHFRNRKEIIWQEDEMPVKKGKILDEYHTEITPEEKQRRETSEGYPLNRKEVADVVEGIQKIKGVKDLNVFSTFREVYVRRTTRFDERGYYLYKADLQHLPQLSMEALYYNTYFWGGLFIRALENINCSLEFTLPEEFTIADYKPLTAAEIVGMAYSYARELSKLEDLAWKFAEGVSGKDHYGRAGFFYHDYGLLQKPLREKFSRKKGYHREAFDLSVLKHFTDNSSYFISIGFWNQRIESKRFKSDMHELDGIVTLYLKPRKTVENNALDKWDECAGIASHRIEMNKIN